MIDNHGDDDNCLIITIHVGDLEDWVHHIVYRLFCDGDYGNLHILITNL